MATTTNYMLLGYDVDKKTYEKFTNKKYAFMNRLVGLDSIHLWATDEEIAAHFPQRAAEAKQIIADIEKEIIAMEKPQTKKTFHSFLDELDTIYKEESGKYFKALEDFGVIQEDYNATMADRNAPEYMKLIARGEFERAKEAMKQSKKEAGESYRTRTKKLREQFQEFANDLYRATPDRIDQSAMQLLNTGIMSADEMEHLAEQYRGNPPMLRIIGQYAQNKADSFSASDADKSRQYRVLSVKMKKITDMENSTCGLDSMIKFGSDGLGNDEIAAKVHNNHWDRICDEARTNYKNFYVQPGGASEE